MFTHRVLDVNLVPWGSWTIPAIGAVAAGLVFLVGWVLFARRRARPEPAEVDPPLATVGLATDPFVQAATADRRSALRRRGNAIAVLISDAEAASKAMPGCVVDRSMGGLCLLVKQSVPPGTILSVRTTNAPESCPWVQLEVRSCRQVERDWELGCEFVSPPPWSVLLLFG